jgi:arylsulfatase A-like enzyme
MIKKTLLAFTLFFLGVVAGIAFFYFGPSYSPSAVEQYVGVTEGDVVLPYPAEPFSGVIRKTVGRSKGVFSKDLSAPEDSPNVLLIMTDDAGFAASSTFGGPVPTPNLDKLAQSGLIYNRFHTTSMCSPTRAALLTGRNAHMVGSGIITNSATGFPGYNAEIPKSAATVGRILTGNGFNTVFMGKHHNVPSWQATAAGPFDLWPTGLGFEYFYGFIDGDTDQFSPKMYRGIQPVEDATLGQEDYILDRDLADETIRWIHNQKAAAPDKPFFIYYAPGTPHAPHQAPREWIEKFKGQFDQGWDRLREEIFKRQLASGLTPADTRLTERPDILPAWESLSSNRKRIASRFMEVFAATLAYQDSQIGRVFHELERMGIMEDTIVFFIQGDNGASAEGALHGTMNEIGTLANKVVETEEWFLSALDEMGGPRSYQTYPAGWAWALDTPFQWFKTTGSHFGGTRNGLVVSWPNGIQARGEIRSQFHHVIDIVPTVLEVCGVPAPDVVDGIRQQRMDGVSMVPTFHHPNAEELRTTQYFELMGNRAIYHDGWIASTTPKFLPWVMQREGSPLDYAWELYNIEEDFSQAINLATEHPEKLEELRSLFWQEAERNNVLPLDHRRGGMRHIRQLLDKGSTRDRYEYWGKGISVFRHHAPPLILSDFTIDAEITVPEGGAHGVLLASGNWFGGWSFYFDRGRPIAHHAFSQQPADQFEIASERVLPPGDHQIRFAFEYDGGGIGKGGDMRILLGDEVIAEGRIERQILASAGVGETLDIGRDTGVTVVADGGGTRAFNGKIHKVEVISGRVNIMSFF